MTSQGYCFAGTVFPTVLCLLLSGVYVRCTASVFASDAAAAKTFPKTEQPHAGATTPIPCSFFAGATPHSTGPKAALTAVDNRCRSPTSVAISASSSVFKAGAAPIGMRWCRNAAANITLPKSPPSAILPFRDWSRLRREDRALLRSVAPHSVSKLCRRLMPCCMSPAVAPISLFFRTFSARVFTTSSRKSRHTRKRCFFPNRFASSSCAAADPSASPSVAAALLSSPSAASSRASGLEPSGGAAAVTGFPTPPAFSPISPATSSSTPASTSTRKPCLYSLIVGGAPPRSALLRSGTPVTAAVLSGTEEQPIGGSLPVRTVRICAVRRSLLLLLPHRRAAFAECSSPPLRTGAGVAAAIPAEVSPADTSLQRGASSASDPLRAIVPPAESGPVAGILAASEPFSVVYSLALPRFLAFSVLLHGLGSVPALPPKSPAAFFPPVVSPLAAAAASCLVHLLPAAAAASAGRSSSPPFAAAPPHTPPSPSCCPVSPSFSSAAAPTVSKSPLQARCLAGAAVSGVSSPASAAPSSASFSTSSFATAQAAAQQQQRAVIMKLEAGDGHGGEGLHYFPSLSPPQLSRHASLARGGSCVRGGSRAPPSPAAGGGATAAGSAGAAGQTGGASVSPSPPASPFCTGGAAAAGREEEEQQEEAATLIFMHGLGDTAAGWSDILTLAASALPNAAAFLRIILPTADVRPVALTGGVPTHAWADVAGLTRNSPEDEAGFLASKARIDTIIKEEVAAGVSPSRILLGGFSQGGAVAYLVGLQSSYRLAGIIALSTWLPLTRSLKVNAAVFSRPRESGSSGSRSPFGSGNSPYASSGSHPYGGSGVGGAGNSSSSTNGSSGSSSGSSSGAAATSTDDPTPVLHCHGEQDEVVSFSYGEESAVHVRQLYMQAGVSTAVADRAVQFRRYPGLGHSASNRELADVKEFIAQCLLH